MNTRDLTLQYLRTLQDQGVTKLPLNEEARLVLREWMLAARAAKKSEQQAFFQQAQVQTAKPTSQEYPPAGRDEVLHAESPQSQYTPPPQHTREDSHVAEQVVAPHDSPRDLPSGLVLPDDSSTSEPSYPPQLTEALFTVPMGSITERWQAFAYLLHHWAPVKELKSLREQLVLGQGKKQADIMFIGDAPNAKDEVKGQPFSGEAGKKLDDILKAMQLTREDIYLTHLVKYRPAMPRQLTNNRPPSPIEIELFAQVLRSEIELVAPRVIVALGVIAARGLLGLGELPLAEYQSQQREYQGIPVLVTHHPSYLLRTTERSERRTLWETMLRCMEIAQLPISAKQQGYFLPKRA